MWDISETYAEIYINNADIAHLEEGQKVRFNVAAYPSSEYGDIIGTVEYISKDIKKDSIQNTPVYYVKVSCENGIVQNWKGETGTLLNGMLAEANIIVGEKSVLQCFLEEVKLWFTE